MKKTKVLTQAKDRRGRFLSVKETQKKGLEAYELEQHGTNKEPECQAKKTTKKAFTQDQ